MRPQAIIVCSRHSSLHLNLSFPLLTSPDEAKKSLLSSLLLVSVVNHRHILVEELTSFYSHTKDTFCHLWLFQCAVRGPFSIPWRRGNAGKQRRPRNILPAFCRIQCNFDSFKKVCQSVPERCQVRSSPCILKKVQCRIQFNLLTDINQHHSVRSTSGLSKPVYSAETIVSPTEP